MYVFSSTFRGEGALGDVFFSRDRENIAPFCLYSCTHIIKFVFIATENVLRVRDSLALGVLMFDLMISA